MTFGKLSKTGTQFNRGAWLTLSLASLLILVDVFQLFYRFTLPTDGWSVYTIDLEESTWIYDANLVGVPSALQAGDAVLRVDDVPVGGTASMDYVSPPPGWQAGEIVTMILRRGGQDVPTPVPVVHWTGAVTWRYNAQQVEQLIGTFGVFVFLGVGWFTFLKRPGVPSARALLLFSTAVGAAYISDLLPDGLSVQFNQLAFYTTAFFSYAIFGTLLAPALLVFSLLFPQPKHFLQKRPWLGLTPFILGLMILVYLYAGGFVVVGWIATMMMILASILSLLHAGYTQTDAISRAQFRWAISGFVVGLGLFLLNFPIAFGWVKNLLLVTTLGAAASLGFPIIGICLAIAVLRYRLFDIDVIIRKTLQYTILTGLLALVYFGSVLLLQSLVENLTGQQSVFVIVISTLVIAALFNPLRNRVQDFIDRRFYRNKYDAEQTLASFASTARDEVDLDELTAALVRVVDETMQPEMVSLWLYKTNKRIRS